MKKIFYPLGPIGILTFIVDFGIFFVMAAIYSSKPILVKGMLPILAAPFIFMYLMRVVIDPEKETVTRAGTTLPLRNIECIPAPAGQGTGISLKDKNSGNDILLVYPLYKKETIEEIEKTIKNRGMI